MAKLFRDESAAFNEAMRIRAYQQTYQGDEQLAGRVVSNQRAWPQLSPGANLAVSQGGHDPDSPVAKEAARLSQKRKAKKSGNWLGNIVRAGTGAVGDVLGMAGEGFSEMVRGSVRGLTTAAGAPIEEVTGGLRSLAGTIGGEVGGAVAGATGGAALGAAVGTPIGGVGAVPGALIGGAIGGLAGILGGKHIEGEGGFRPQSTLAQVIQGKDPGTGFLPGGEAHEAAVQARRQTATVGGSALTLGRLTAVGVTEPGTTQYNILSGLIDFGAAIKLDPTALGLAKGARVNAVRKTILKENADQFLNSKAGDQLIHALAEQNSPFTILDMSRARIGAGQLGDPQLPVDVAVRLANSTDPNDVRRILQSELGTNVRSPFSPTVRRRLGRERLTLDMPHQRLEWDDPQTFIKDLDAFQGLMNVPQQTRIINNDKMLRALSGDRGGRLPAVREVADTMRAVLVAQGLDPKMARKMTRLIPENIKSAQLYTASEIAQRSSVPGFALNGQLERIAGPSLVSELLDAPLHLPSRAELRVLRRDLTFAKSVLANPVANKMELGGTFLMNKIWKPATLARFALTVRVIGEEQIRMAAAGYDSVFNHPFSYMARLVGERGKTGMTGAKLADSVEAQNALTQRGLNADLMGESKTLIHTRHRAPFAPGDDDFVRAWRDHELGHLRADPVAQHLAKNGPDATKNWLWNGGGRKFLNDWRANRPNDPTFMASEIDVSIYVDDVVGKRLADFTQGDERLLNHVIKGRLPKNSPGEAARRKEITSIIDELIEGGRQPAQAIGDIAVEGRKVGMDGATNWMFENLLSKPTDTLNRSKTFNQAYWNRGEELITSMTPKAQQAMLKNARKAKLPREQIRRLEERAASHSGDTGLAQSDFIAKSFALEEVKTLLYDLSKRGMDADAVRLIMPFAEPWKEMMKTWSRLLVTKPQTARRVQQVVEGARGAGAFKIDEQTGEEVFVYPGSEFISKVITGLPIPFKGRVAGLNLFADNPIMPGFGPLVQIPVQHILDDKPEFDWVQDAVNPFGRNDEGLFEQILAPAAWMGKVKTAFSSPESDRLFANTVMDISRYLVSTGEYNTNTPEEQERLTQAAKSKAKRLYLLRAAGSFSAPSAPSPEFKSALKDISGKTVTQFALIEEYHALQADPGVKTKVGERMVEGVGYDNAVETFLDTYGEGALLYMQPKSKGGGPPVEEAQEWIRDNPELSSQFPDVYHFFGPRSGEFSMTAYERQLVSGEREAISPKEATQLANHRVAMLRWRQAKDKVGARPNDIQREWLNGIKNQLLDLYPGFEPEPRDPFRVKRMMRQLQDGLKDEKLASTEVGEALRVYFLARDKAVQSAKNAGLADHTRSKKLANVREWLRGIGASIVERVPDFAAVYDQVLDREMVEDKADIGGSELPSG